MRFSYQGNVVQDQGVNLLPEEVNNLLEDFNEKVVELRDRNEIIGYKLEEYKDSFKEIQELIARARQLEIKKETEEDSDITKLIREIQEVLDEVD